MDGPLAGRAVGRAVGGQQAAQSAGAATVARPNGVDHSTNGVVGSPPAQLEQGIDVGGQHMWLK